MRPSLFWDLTQRRLVVYCRRVGTAYLSHFQRSSIPDCWTLENGNKWSLPKRRQRSTNLHFLTFQKTKDPHVNFVWSARMGNFALKELVTDEAMGPILMEYITLRLDSTNEVEQW